MKIFPILIIFGFQLQVQAFQRSHFRCDVPDEWLFGIGTDNFMPGTKWPGAVVKYEIHPNLKDNDKQEVQKAFHDIQSKTCIRFEPRAPEERAYVLIEIDDNVCGIANGCRLGIPQSVKFGSGCSDMNVIVHELGHALCLGHEQSRKDRDEFLHFDGCSPQEIPGKDMNNDLRGSLYDHASQMHYQCRWCPGGWPRSDAVPGCGEQIQQGLSVLDADKLNDFYDCRGCKTHRWRPIDALTDADRRSMMQMGRTEDGQPLFPCRGHINGEIAIGKYWETSGICYVPYHGGEHQLTTHAQVLTWPSGFTANEIEKSTYRIVNVTGLLGGKITVEGVPGGRTSDGVTEYIAVADIEYEGKRESSIGKVLENSNVAYFPFWGKELLVDYFGVVVC